MFIKNGEGLKLDKTLFYSYLCLYPHIKPGKCSGNAQLFSYLVKTDLKKILFIILLLSGIGLSEVSYAQTGGRKRETRGKRRGNFRLTQWKSQGHADAFARGNNGR